MKKLPNKVTTEELLAALEATPDDQVPNPIHEIFEYRNDVPRFLAKYGIEDGPNLASRNRLFILYNQYSESPVNRKTFCASLTNFVQAIGAHSVSINLTKVELESLISKGKHRNGKFTPASVGTRKHIEDFLNECEVLGGTKWVESWVLHHIYKKWCRQTRKLIRFKLGTFSSVMKLFLESKKSTYINSWFKVNERILSTLTEQDKRKIEHDRKERNKLYQKEQTKRR